MSCFAQASASFPPMMQHHPCNRFGFGLNPHQVNYPAMHQHHPAAHSTYHQHQQAASNYATSNQHLAPAGKPTSPCWPGQQFSVGRDLPLTPPADRESSSSVAPVMVSSPQPYYSHMLHGPSAANYPSHHSPVDKSMTPPQDPSAGVHHQPQYHHQPETHQAVGWWNPTPAPASSVSGPVQTDFSSPSFHHHHHIHQQQQQMLSHHHSAVAAASSGSVSPCTASQPHHNGSMSSNASPNPSEFQQRVAAALLKTHVTLASRRCRRCRCPNCQVLSHHPILRQTEFVDVDCFFFFFP